MREIWDITKNEIRSSCEIEDFVETHLCKLCVILRSRVLGLSVLIKDIGRRLPLQLQCSYQGQQGDVTQSVRGNYKTRFWGGQNLTAVEGNVSVYRVNPVSRITGEGGAEFWRTWGPGFDQKRAGLEGGGGRAGNLCVEAINPFKGINLTVLGKKKKKKAPVDHRGGGWGMIYMFDLFL